MQKNPFSLALTSGRLRLELEVRLLGQDVQICLAGGEAHLGAVALALPDRAVAVLTHPGHREDALAAEMAETVSRTLGCTVCVSAGIHYEAISKQEITQVETMTQELTRQCLALLEAQKSTPYAEHT